MPFEMLAWLYHPDFEGIVETWVKESSAGEPGHLPWGPWSLSCLTSMVDWDMVDGL